MMQGKKGSPLWGLLMFFEKTLQQKTGVRPDFHSGSEKGKQLKGAKALLEKCGGDEKLAQEVIQKWIEGNDDLKYTWLTNVAQFAPRLIWQIRVEEREQGEGYIRRKREVTL